MDDLGYVDADRDCPYCDGALWKNDHLLVCADCYAAIGEQEHHQRRTPNHWDRFETDRPTYTSRHDRCVGGITSAYIGDGSYEFGYSSFSLE